MNLAIADKSITYPLTAVSAVKPTKVEAKSALLQKYNNKLNEHIYKVYKIENDNSGSEYTRELKSYELSEFPQNCVNGKMYYVGSASVMLQIYIPKIVDTINAIEYSGPGGGDDLIFSYNPEMDDFRVLYYGQLIEFLGYLEGDLSNCPDLVAKIHGDNFDRAGDQYGISVLKFEGSSGRYESIKYNQIKEFEFVESSKK
jgi:hypothetical protein